jgi:branched-subunit amino acid aminotransferase/4-amino-4-deoxychorismate lyase
MAFMPAELDGTPVSADQALALGLGNYGHFTTMLVEHRRVKGLDLHLDRLVHDCAAVFGTTPDPDRIRGLVRSATAGVAGAVVVRVTMFDPELNVAHPGRTAQPRVLVTFRAAPDAPLPPIRVRSVPYEREFAAVKHTGLFGTLGHKRQAQLAGHDDALFTDTAGRVSEGTTWNVCFADGGDGVLWPDAEHLPGVTKRLVQRGLAELGLASGEAPVGMVRARTAHAAFATNAVVGVRPVSAIDDVEIPGDPDLLALVRKAYEAIPETEL